MADTIRTLSNLLQLLPNGVQAAISAQDLRDAVVSQVSMSGQNVVVAEAYDQGDGDSAMITRALAAMSAGQTLVLSKATYSFTSPVAIPTGLLAANLIDGGLVIRGLGFGACTVSTSSASGSLFTCTASSGFGPWNLTFEGITFNATSTSFNGWHLQFQNINRLIMRDCMVIGNCSTTTNTAGVKLVGGLGVPFTFGIILERTYFFGASLYTDGVTDSWVERCIFDPRLLNGTHARQYCITLDNGCGDWKIFSNHFIAAPNGSIQFLATGNEPLNVNIAHNLFDTSDQGTADKGIYIPSGANGVSVLSNSFFAIPNNAIYAKDVAFCAFNDNNFYSCGGLTGTGTVPTIQFATSSSSTCVYNLVSGNTFRHDGSGTATYAISEATNSCYRNVYGPNIYAGGTGYVATQIQFGAANENCTLIPSAGLVTTSGGTATITSAATTVTVTHGLSFTPNLGDISVTPGGLGSAAKWWISGITSTQFVINVNAAPGSSITFGWRCAYRSNSLEA